ncbi:polyketide cyclase [Paenibacillus sp. H1-7]|uniref:SRPBCC family protein n=1 Tax=Paenibacillus sp. H1-7 TaxID=2282849 RepID=UPI001EF8DC7E|nr:SRPBCC family protein [Paenibacillus sp. H1-7]ULL16406.1 polyketide cyclase [Paenibacillus sp. H1-7]
MNERSIKYTTFVIERNYSASPERVCTSWSDLSAKARWYPKADEFDFRVGGREINRGNPSGGPIFTFDACYQKIVQNSRIVYTYTLDQGETRISVSLTTAEIKPVSNGTQLIYEQGAFLDGHNTPEQREYGTKFMLDKLSEQLENE